MIFELTLLGITAFSTLFGFLALVFMVKNREFERAHFESSLNGMIFGVFFVWLISLIFMLKYLDLVFHGELATLLPEVTTYITYLTNIAHLALGPLFAVCFVVGVFLARDAVE